MRSIIVFAVFAFSAAAHAIGFSPSSPLPQSLRSQMTAIVADKCNVGGMRVVESRTLVSDEVDTKGESIEKYFTSLAVLTPSGEVYAAIELLAEVTALSTQVSILRSPVCRK